MNKRARLIRVVRLYYCALVVGAMLAQRGGYLHARRALPPELFPVTSIPYTFGKTPGPAPKGPPRSMYRQSPAHTGVDERFVISRHLAPSVLLGDLNVGIHGASKASPAVDETGIYVGSDTGWFYALNLDGSVRWRYFASDAARGVHGTAATDDERVYFGTYNGDLIALNKSDGTPAWEIRLGGTIGSSPVLIQDFILLAVETTGIYNGYLMKIDRATGNVIWRSRYLGEQAHSSPTVDPGSGLVFLGANNKQVFAFHVEDGRQEWQVRVDGQIKSTLTSVDGKVYATTLGGSLYCLEASSGKLVWRAWLPGPSQSSPSLVPDTGSLVVSVDKGDILSLDAKSGRVLWRATQSYQYSRMPSALVSPGPGAKKGDSHYLIWIACQDQGLCALDPKTGKVLSRIPLPGSLTGVPVAFKDSLYVALNESGLVRLSPKRGAHR